jgi:hypothetical protein
VVAVAGRFGLETCGRGKTGNFKDLAASVVRLRTSGRFAIIHIRTLASR